LAKRNHYQHQQRRHRLNNPNNKVGLTRVLMQRRPALGAPSVLLQLGLETLLVQS
jgi:hypothetical protein